MKILILNTEKYKNEINHNSTVCVCAFLCFLFSLLLKLVTLALFHLHSHAMGRKTINFLLASLYSWSAVQHHRLGILSDQSCRETTMSKFPPGLFVSIIGSMLSDGAPFFESRQALEDCISPRDFHLSGKAEFLLVT